MILGLHLYFTKVVSFIGNDKAYVIKKAIGMYEAIGF